MRLFCTCANLALYRPERQFMENLLNAPRKPVISREFNSAHLEPIVKELFPLDPHDPDSVAGLMSLSDVVSTSSTPSTPPSSAPATSPPAINTNPDCQRQVTYPDIDDIAIKLEF